MKEIKAPNKIDDAGHTIFLAGSIEMGKAENWQDKVVRLLKNEDVIIFNPRRDDWDSSWEQDISNKQFRKQVEWELRAMTHADKILMYFSPGTKSPISLLELGLFAESRKLVVVCPKGFWKKGNVDVVCKKYEVVQKVSKKMKKKKRMKTKTTKTWVILTIIGCALLSIWDFYLGWGYIRIGEYGWALLYFILGTILTYCFLVNLRTLQRIRCLEKGRINNKPLTKKFMDKELIKKKLEENEANISVMKEELKKPEDGGEETLED